jgi:1-acyl-sn-glycerol-3-phosphate acyltransferase
MSTVRIYSELTHEDGRHVKTSLLQRSWVTFTSCAVVFYASVLNRFAIKGAENIPASGGVLLAANHISAFETMFIPAAVICRHRFQMVWAPAKEELFAKPLPRLIFSSWGAFPVRRGRDVKANRVIENLLRDQKVMLFPEGTRHRDGRLGKGNRGVGKIILETRPVIIPTALVGLNRWKFAGLGQTASVVFGKPLDIGDLYQMPNCKETHQLIVERVMNAIAEQLKQEGAYVGQA